MRNERTSTAAQAKAIGAALQRYRPLFDRSDGPAEQQGPGAWNDFIGALTRPLPVCVWGHPMRVTAGRLAALLAADGIAARPLGWRGQVPGGAFRLGADDAAQPDADQTRAGQRWWYCAGLAHAQEEVSQLPVTLLDLAPGQRVLDLCAAPGGKTAQIALALGNRGTVIANDISPQRLAALQGNLDRLGIVNVSTTWCDGGNYPAAVGGFDRILLDAPCSSEGTLRRHTSLAARLRDDRTSRMLPRQRALLAKAIQLCRPGGRIVYSTCTFAPEENELQIEAALAAQGGRLRLLPVEVPGLIVSPGLTHWQGRALDPCLARCLRLWPQHNDTGGFFVAVLEKAPDAPGPPATHLAPEPATPGTCAPTRFTQTVLSECSSTLDAADQAHLDALWDQFGLPADLWQDYRAQRQTRRGLHLMAADHQPPTAPVPQASGLFALRTNCRPPKLTTAAALLLGSRATRRQIDLDEAGRDAYLRRAPQLLQQHPGPPEVPPAAQAPSGVADLTPGQVLVQYQGIPLGVARWHRSGTLESLFPGRWSGCTGAETGADKGAKK